MKKYRPIKLLLILLALIAFGVLFGAFLMDGWKKVVMLICTLVILFAFVLCATYFIQFQDDKIIIRHGLSSFNKSYSSNFKTRRILICDIDDLLINSSTQSIIIRLKNGANILLNVNGYFNASEIINEFARIKKQLG